MPAALWAQEPYAVLSDDNHLLTFYYDDQRAARGGMTIEDTRWLGEAQQIREALFDDSFSQCQTLTSTAYWFNGCFNLEVIIAWENLHTQNVTDMSYMFAGCNRLAYVDLSGFDTRNVTDMTGMFQDCSFLEELDLRSFNTARVTNMEAMFIGCRDLRTIFVGNGWTTAAVTASDMMFMECERLVGGMGTQFDPDITDASYAHADGGADNPGYLTFDGEGNIDEPDPDGPRLMLWRQVGGKEYRLYKSLDRSNLYTNADGWNMYQTRLTLDIVAGNDTTSYTVSERELFTTEGFYDNAFTPCMMIDVAGNRIYVFSNSKDGNGDYAMTGYLFSSPLDEPAFESEIVYERRNWGWWPHFNGLDNGRPVLRHFSYAGYYGLVSRYSDADGWTVEDEGKIQPNDYNSLWQRVNRVYVNGNGNRDEVTIGNVTYTLRPDGNAWISWIDNRTSMERFDIRSTINVDGQRKQVTGIAPYTFYESSALATVAIPRYVREIGESAFVKCYDLNPIQVAASEPPTLLGTQYGVTQFEGIDTEYCMLYVPQGTSAAYRAAEGWNKFQIVEELLHTEAPVLRFDSDDLTMTCNTEGASIYYTIGDMVDTDDAQNTDLLNALEDSLLYGQKDLYTGPINITRNVYVKAYAVGEGRMGSEIVTLRYNYLLWRGLLNTIYEAMDVYERSEGDARVPEDLRREFREVIDISYHFYNQRIGEDPEIYDYIYRLLDYIQRIEDLMNQEPGPGPVNPTETAAVPTFRFTNERYNNLLTISSETDGAVIYYAVTDLNNPDMTVLDSLRNGQGTLYTEPFNLDRSSIVMAYATREGMLDSETSTLEYNLEVWERLLELEPYCGYVENEARERNANEDIMNRLYAVQAMIKQTFDEYVETRVPAEEIEDRTMRIYAELQAILDMLDRSSFDGLTARVVGNDTLDDAFANVGRETAAQTIAAIVWEANYALTSDMLAGIENPNLLVYVNDATLAPASVQNVVINGVANRIILTDVAEGNNNFYCPQAFQAVQISYEREFSQTTEIGVSRGWESIALPFDVQTITHETKGVISPFGNAVGGYNFWLRQMGDNGLERATQIEANRGYVISMPNSLSYPEEYLLPGVITFSAENVTVPVSEMRAESNADGSLRLVPTFQRVAQTDGVYALNVGEQRGDYAEGSVFEKNYRMVRPFEAYSMHDARQGVRSDMLKYLPIQMMMSDGQTGIETIRTADDGNGKWYSLDGRQLNARPTAKGVYIRQGQKVVIK